MLSPHVVQVLSSGHESQPSRQAAHWVAPMANLLAAHWLQVVPSLLQSPQPSTWQSRHSRPVVPVPLLAMGQVARHDSLSRARYLLSPQVAHVLPSEAHAVQLEACTFDAQHWPPMQEALLHSLAAEQVVPAAFFGEHLESALRKWVGLQVLHLPVEAAQVKQSVAYVLAQQRAPMQKALVHSLAAEQVAPAAFFGEHLESAIA